SGEADFRGRRVEDPGEERLLETQGLPHALLDAAGGQQMNYLNGQSLAEAMHSADALLQARGIPGRLEINYRRGSLQVESHAPGVGGEKYSAVRIVSEFLHQGTAFAGRHSAVQGHEAYSQLPQFFPCQMSHPLVLAEDHHLALFFERQFANDFAKFIELGRMIRFLVEEKR